MKAISFLGKTRYTPTTYVYDAQEYETRFFPAALVHFLDPEKLLVFVTPTVRDHENMVKLGEELDILGVNWEAVVIPESHNESDLWRIFDRLTESVADGESVIFDITHSFRSLPMLVFLAVAYLKAAKDVSVEKILYGAWEARDEENNRSPVFDLTPFTALLDWLTATSRFVETGDGYSLSKLLKEGMPSGVKMGTDLEARTLGHSLKSAAQAIDSTSLALRITRPLETMQSANHMVIELDEAMPAILQRAKPFGILAEQMKQAYGQFALDNPTGDEALKDGLMRQLAMIDWYLKRRQVVQAVTLAREWIVSLLAFNFNASMFDYEGTRRQVEYALNNAVERRKDDPHIKRESRFDKRIEKLPQIDSLCGVWSRMTSLRNDIAHAGMRSNARTAARLVQNAKDLYPQLESLAAELLD